MRRHIFRGERLRQERERLGLSQHELARRIGTGPNQVSRYETGESEPSTVQLAYLARELSVTTDYLLGLTDGRDFEVLESDLPPHEREFLTALRQGNAKTILRLMAQTLSNEETPGENPKRPKTTATQVTSDH